jgi:hypothetical protein
MGTKFALPVRMWARTAAIRRAILIYAFVAIVGTLGGRIVAAVWIYTQSGWTATWLQISTWGPSLKPEPVATSGAGGAA